jgi:hypothetical protein
MPLWSDLVGLLTYALGIVLLIIGAVFIVIGVVAALPYTAAILGGGGILFGLTALGVGYLFCQYDGADSETVGDVDRETGV